MYNFPTVFGAYHACIADSTGGMKQVFVAIPMLLIRLLIRTTDSASMSKIVISYQIVGLPLLADSAVSRLLDQDNPFSRYRAVHDICKLKGSHC